MAVSEEGSSFLVDDGGDEEETNMRNGADRGRLRAADAT